jgi:hypothetical protein
MFSCFYGFVNSCGEINMYVLYVVSCVGKALIPVAGYCGSSCSIVLLC